MSIHGFISPSIMSKPHVKPQICAKDQLNNYDDIYVILITLTASRMMHLSDTAENDRMSEKHVSFNPHKSFVYF